MKRGALLSKDSLQAQLRVTGTNFTLNVALVPASYVCKKNNKCPFFRKSVELVKMFSKMTKHPTDLIKCELTYFHFLNRPHVFIVTTALET